MDENIDSFSFKRHRLTIYTLHPTFSPTDDQASTVLVLSHSPVSPTCTSNVAQYLWRPLGLGHSLAFFPLQLLLRSQEVLPCINTVLHQKISLSATSFQNIISVYPRYSPKIPWNESRITHLLMIHKVEHGDDMQHLLRICRCPRRHTLKIRVEPGYSIQRLLVLDLLYHLLHVHLNFPCILRPSPKTHCPVLYQPSSMSTSTNSFQSPWMLHCHSHHYIVIVFSNPPSFKWQPKSLVHGKLSCCRTLRGGGAYKSSLCTSGKILCKFPRILTAGSPAPTRLSEYLGRGRSGS